jgi:hypothetical protein
MRLADSLKQIRNFDLDAGPFLEVFDQSRDLILECSQTGIPQEAKEHLASFVAQLDKERAEFLEVFNSGISELKTDLARSCDTIAQQMIDREQQLLEIRKLQEQIDAIPIPPDDAEHNPFHPANLIASVPTPVPLLTKAADLPFSGGHELVKTVLTLKSTADFELEGASRHQRTTGNIWENWKKPGE